MSTPAQSPGKSPAQPALPLAPIFTSQSPRVQSGSSQPTASTQASSAGGPTRTSKSPRKTKSQPKGPDRNQHLLDKYNFCPVTVRPGASIPQHSPVHAASVESVPGPATTPVHAVAAAPPPLALQHRCQGYHIAFPPNKSPHLDYPFALHGPQLRGEPLPWRYEAVDDHTMSLISNECTTVADSYIDEPRCQHCDLIGTHKRFPRLMECIQGGQKANAPLKDYGIGGLIDKDRQKRSQIDALAIRLRVYEPLSQQ